MKHFNIALPSLGGLCILLLQTKTHMSLMMPIKPPSFNSAEKFFKFMNRYLCVTLSYGFVRAVTYDYEGTKNYYNQKTQEFETKPMLYIDDIGRVLFRTLAAGTAWPIMLSDDLARLECAARGKDPAEYSLTASNKN